MKKGKQTQAGRLNSCLIAVWLLLTILSGFLMVMLASTRAQAAERDLPEVLRYAQDYTRTTKSPPALQPEESLSRRLARSELIRRQQQGRIAALEKQLTTQPGLQDEVARLSRELKASGETVRTLTQQLGLARQEKADLQTAEKTTRAQLTTVEQEKVALQARLESGKTALAQAESGLNKQAGEMARLSGELATVQRDAATLEKQKTELEASLAAAKKSTQTVSLKTAEARQAYAAGVLYARDVREARDGNRMLGIHLDPSALMAGLTDALAGNKLRLAPDALADATLSLEKTAAEAFRTVTARQAALAEKWLKKFRKEEGAARDGSGFWYRVTYGGDGEYLKPDDTVDVVVEERLADGTVVSDMDRAGSSLRQKVADFPPVFAAGLARLKNHGQITLAVPPELAYGDRGYPPDVPPGAMMIYTIRVSDVIPAMPETAAGRQQK
ncbi:FKBP-type peptidyl-prolyl cis-trans isomerase [Citrobacter sedlakii]|uniref:FKBP-type peptidyl-prolyl cis-trans isomerase N-terminal domain-containing protein n=1 Tax=Citrobacter sedlakii TaxID=67826 RepID=UPI0022B4168D|nr:FKBP-type peptidyl-prolyl cis-trans isomerase N-terminal domain-containing protein [Citrobacter sedlakii]MCZ4677293.1 FKBP-type peptidyl-prolyl cis-trans isomerase [Citrobacter sedlakii]MDR5007350.1 FKBP-type peptidyl-prolyl cis-trans isomerase N-terminal domain-containing protein [Citrobacter sedlakii]